VILWTLHAERESREVLDRIRAEIGTLMFSAQYQQRPVPVEGNLIKRDWFRLYDQPPQPGPRDHVAPASADACINATESLFAGASNRLLQQKSVHTGPRRPGHIDHLAENLAA
jgi:hypothetical protein